MTEVAAQENAFACLSAISNIRLDEPAPPLNYSIYVIIF